MKLAPFNMTHPVELFAGIFRARFVQHWIGRHGHVARSGMRGSCPQNCLLATKQIYLTAICD